MSPYIYKFPGISPLWKGQDIAVRILVRVHLQPFKNKYRTRTGMYACIYVEGPLTTVSIWKGGCCERNEEGNHLVLIFPTL